MIPGIRSDYGYSPKRYSYLRQTWPTLSRAKLKRLRSAGWRVSRNVFGDPIACAPHPGACWFINAHVVLEKLP